MGLKALEVQQGDLVFCSSLTFSATCNPIIYQNARPVFIDSEYETWNMDPKALEKLDRLKNSYDESKQKINTAKVYLKKAKKTKIRDKKVIFYCICGEGMGHAIRSSVIIDRIKDKYDVYIFSSNRTCHFHKKSYNTLIIHINL